MPAQAPLCAAGAQIEVILKLRGQPRSQAVRRRLARLLGNSPEPRVYLTRAEHAEIFGARSSDIATVRAFAAEHGLTVAEVLPARRSVRLRGRVDRLQRAFSVKLRTVRRQGRRYHAHRERVRLPPQLVPLVRTVLGLDTRPIFQPDDGAAAAAGPGLSPRAVCDLYQFPAGLDGTGQCLALIEVNSTNNYGALATGYLDADTAQACAAFGLPPPAVEAIPPERNLPGPNPGADGEAALDLQVAIAAAPGARIAVYFGDASPAGYHDAVSAAIHDAVRNPRVISTSWSAPEDEYDEAFLAEMDQLFQEAAHLGITVCASAGDYGSSGRRQGAANQQLHPHFPATSPFVLACGGTSLVVTGPTVTDERAWNGGYAAGAGGGGVSENFPRPAWQAMAHVPLSAQRRFAGRGVPDVAAHADPSAGYQVVVAGVTQVLGGTSAVAPLVAGLCTRINQARAAAQRPPVGYINPQLYGQPDLCRAVTAGSNDIDGSFGRYTAGPGWNPCTGLGSLRGAALLRSFSLP